MENPADNMTPWSVVIGRRNVDKGGALQRVGEHLSAAGRRVGGFLQPRAVGPSDELLGWDIVHPSSGERVPLVRESKTPERCNWGFDEAAFAQARRWLLEPGYDVLLVGGIGLEEAAGRGHWPALVEAMKSRVAAHVVVGVRQSCLTQVVLALPDPVASLELPAGPGAELAFANEVGQLIAASTTVAQD